MRPIVLLALAGTATYVAGTAGQSSPARAEVSDSMRVELVVPRKVAAGAPVTMVLRIGNTARRPLELHLQGRSVIFDLAVRRHDSVVWRRLEGTAAPAILQLRMLAPGEVLELKDVWEQKDNGGGDVGPGEYSVTATVPTDAAPIRAGPVPLTVEG